MLPGFHPVLGTAARLLAGLFLSVATLAAQDEEPIGLRSIAFTVTKDPGAGDAPADAPLFEKVDPAKSGIDFVIPIDVEHRDARLYDSAMACGAVAAGDLDGDGRIDLFFACGAAPNRLYRQTDESFVFEDVTREAGVAMRPQWSTAATLVDIDADGDLDIHVSCYDDENRLFINDSAPGEMRFTERAADFGLNLIDASLGTSFVDYDRDGDLDALVVMNAFHREDGRPVEGVPLRQVGSGWEVVPPWDRFYGFDSIDIASGRPTYTEVGRPNRLLRNDEGRFVDVTAAAGLSQRPSFTTSACWWDYDGDGWLDVYLSNDGNDPDECYRNLGDGTFAEVAARLFPHTSWLSKGAAAEDFNQDGQTDLLSTDVLPLSRQRERHLFGDRALATLQMSARGLPRQKVSNALFVNAGLGLFFEAAAISGVARSDHAWTVKTADFDGDGRIDLFFPTGHVRDFLRSGGPRADPEEVSGNTRWQRFRPEPELRQANLAFRNRGGFDFSDVGEAWGLASGEEMTMSYAAAVADIDGDGDPDLVVVHLDQAPTLWRNRSAETGGGRSVAVSLDAADGNRRGVGARVTMEDSSGRIQTRTLLPSNGYGGSDPPELSFGLGEAESVAVLTVDWPDGSRQRFENLPGGRRFEVTRSKPTAIPDAETDQPMPTWFRATSALAGVEVKEPPFDEFSRQPLLPRAHSRFGPGQAWGDADGDGFDDLYLGSPRGVPGRLLLSRGNDHEGSPQFGLRLQPPFNDPVFAEREDLGCVFFDADVDGDEDLFVVSGGSAWDPGDGRYQDRLYLNDGEANFTEAALGSLPESTPSGSVAAVADFDRDGDLDVFVGGRVVPGGYPRPARSSLLVNDGKGRLSDHAFRVSDHLGRTGMVTSALWTDVDDDGWLDLLVAHEWGAVRLFANRQGKQLEDVTAEAGLAAHLGLWNSLAGRDLDGDSDIDYVVGNVGLNAGIAASGDRPLTLYHGDLDGSGARRLIEAQAEIPAGPLLPLTGAAELRRFFPSLSVPLDNVSVAELFGRQAIVEATRLELNQLASVVLRNDGSGRFTVEPLPWLAQLSPVFGISLGEFDGDGLCDAVLAQNFSWSRSAVGPLDGGLGVLLFGARAGDAGEPESAWRVPWPQESGLVIAGDGRSVGSGDLNADGYPDLVVGVNDAPPRLLLNQAGMRADGGRMLKVRLRGSDGNLTAIGARVRLMVEGLEVQTAEQQGGGGFISQQSPVMFFGLGRFDDDAVPSTAIEVRWPDGQVLREAVAPETLARGALVLVQPEAK